MQLPVTEPTMTTCPMCAEDIAPVSARCPHCDHEIGLTEVEPYPHVHGPRATCPMCAEDITAQDAVCPHCGYTLQPAPPIPGGRFRKPDAAAQLAMVRHPPAVSAAQYLVPIVLTVAALVAVVIWRGGSSSTPPTAPSTAPADPDTSVPPPPPPSPPPSPAAPAPPPLPVAPPTPQATGDEEPRVVGEGPAGNTAQLTPSSFSASSFIGNRRRQHAPERAFDGDPATAWNENESGPGDGSWIAATFSGVVTVRRVTLTTGFDASSPRHGDLFPLNSHLRRVRISFDGGHAVERDVAEDQRALVLDGLNVRTRTLRIEALSVWPGSRWADLCISEVNVEGDGPGAAQVGPGANQPDGEQRGRTGSQTARCTYATHTSFHLRTMPTVGRGGAEEIRSLPVVEVLGAGDLRRGGDRAFHVRVLDGSRREGWMFIPTQELGADCPN